MKHSILSILLLFFLSCNLSKQDQDEPSLNTYIEVKVTDCIDGDTIVCTEQNGEPFKVRLLGVNCPELSTEEYYSKESSSYTKSMLIERTVFLESDETDSDIYGRKLRYVWLSKPDNKSESEVKSKMFNSYLLSGGYAKTLLSHPDLKYASVFTSSQQEAIDNSRGIFYLTFQSSNKIPQKFY